MDLQLSNAMESCYAKTVMSGAMGFAMGGLFGMFMASVRNPLPFGVEMRLGIKSS
jgi:import inner membrane translocase subunit TIM22